MTENDKAWQRNTPERRTQRRANWCSWADKKARERLSHDPKPTGSYRQGQRWT